MASTKDFIVKNGLLVLAQGSAQSTSTTTGAIVTPGGAGIGGNLNVGNNIASSNLTVSTTYGAELCPALTSGNWSSNNYTVTGGTIVHTTGTVGSTQPSTPIATVIGQTYKIIIVVASVTPSYLWWQFGGYQYSITTAGTITQYITAKSTQSFIIYNQTISEAVTITSVSITAMAVGGNLTVDNTATFNGPVKLNALGVGISYVPNAPIEVGDLGGSGIRVSRNNTPGAYIDIHMAGGVGPTISGVTGQKRMAFYNDSPVQGIEFYPNNTYAGQWSYAGSLLVATTSQSTSTSSGALQVGGGAGVSGNLYVGGLLSVAGSILGTINTATNIAGGTTGAIHYQSAAGITQFIGIGASGTVLQSNGTTATWVSTSSLGLSTGAASISPYSGIFTITNTTVASSTTTGALQVAGGAGIGGNLYVGGSAYLTGDLYVDGTQFSVNSTSIITGDKTITLSSATTVAATAIDSGLIVGTGTGFVSFLFDGTASWKSKGSIIPNGTQNLGALGTPWNVVYGNSVYDNGNRVVTSVTPSAGAGISITNLSANGPAAVFTITNTGVISLTAGTGTSVSSSNGAITVWSTATLQSVTDRGASTTNAVSITNTTASTSTTSGALLVAGGAGIGGTLNVGNGIYATGTSTFKSTVNFVSTNSSATIVARMLTSDVLTFSGARGQLFSISDSFTGTIFAVNDISGVPSIEVYDTGNVSLAETFGNVGIGNASPTSKLTVNGTVTISGITTVTNTTQASSTATGALQVAGGAGIAGNLYVGGIIYGIANITGTITTATNVTGGTAGQLHYQTAPGLTNFAGPGTAGQILTSGGTGAPVYQSTLTLAGTTLATSTTTGALIVAGGVGVGGSLYATQLYDNSTRVLTSVTPTAGTAISVTSVSTSNGNTAFTINNTGVTSLAGSTYLGASAATGAITLTNLGVQSLTGSTGLAVSSSTGTVTITNLGVLSATGTTYLGVSASTGSVTFTNLGVQSLTGTSALGVSASTGTITLTNLGVQQITTGSGIVVSASTGSVQITSIDTLQTVVGRGNSTTNIISITNTTSATSTTTGALLVAGGVGIGGSLYVAGEIVANKLTIQYTTVTTTLVVTDDVIQTVNNTQSTSTSSGALLVAGGAGIGGDVWVGGNIYSAGSRVLTTATLGNYGVAQIVAGTAIGVSPATGTGTVTITNLGVQTLTAGTDTAVSASTGTITVWNTSTLQSITNRGAATTNAISITTNTVSASTNSGQALLVSGGIGALAVYATNLFDSGRRVLSSVTPVAGTAITITAISTSDTNTTFTVNNNGVTQAVGTTYLGVSASTGNITFTNLGVQSLTAGADLSVTASTGTITISSTATLQSITNRGFTTTNAINITNATQSTSTTTGALIITGGVGVGGALYAGNLNSTDITLANTRIYGVTRSIPTTINDEVDIGSVSLSNGGGSFDISIVVPSSSFSVSKHYLLPINYNESGGWVTAVPIADGGPYNGNNYDLDVNVSGLVASFRLRRTLGSTGGTAYISIKQSGQTLNFTESLSTSSVTAPAAYYNAAVVTQVDGSAIVRSTVSSTSTATGALQVAGGVGVGGAVYATSMFSNNAAVWTTATLTNLNQLTNGPGYLTSSTIGLYGVSAISAGTDTAVSASTGSVVIWNTSTLQSITNRGATTTNAISFTNATQSTSTATGGLIVTGGVGVGGNVYIGGLLNVAGGVTGTITTATNVAGGTAGQLHYQTGVGTTGFAGPGTAGQVLVSNGTSAPAYQNTLTLAGTTVSTSTITGALIVAGGVGIGGSVYIGGGVASVSTTTGALVITGGVGISGALNATTKSFNIGHPTKPGKQLRYGSLEGPEFGVYVRGRVQGNTIELPDYWTKLVDPESITVSLTPIGNHQKVYVDKIENNTVYIGVDGWFAKDINCFYTVYGERADVDKLDVEG